MMQVVWFSIRAVYDDLFVLAGIGGLWLVVSLLVPAAVFWLTGFFPVSIVTVLLNLGSFVLVPPCTAAVYNVSVQVAKEKRIEFGYFWQGIKAHWKTSYKIAGILFISGGIIVFNALFYFNNSQNTFFLVAGILVLWFLLFWLCVQIYLWPLVISQEEKRIVLMIKNASALTLAFPFFAFMMMTVIVLVTVLSVALPFLLLLWMPFVSVLSSRAFVSSLQQADDLKQKWHTRDAGTN
ncbi:MAG: hypothetical protein JXA89_08760 [Anaerolineae bacterium]|nr:hypothetical protein [Anaerolineae bacterium]